MCDVQIMQRDGYLSAELIASVRNSLSHHLHGDNVMAPEVLADFYRYLRSPAAASGERRAALDEVRRAIEAISAALDDPPPGRNDDRPG